MIDEYYVELVFLKTKEWMIKHIEKRTNPLEDRIKELEVKLRILEDREIRNHKHGT
jgi:hypothetical protein